MAHDITPYRIIALEGTEGSGKSTQANILRERLITSGRSAIVVNELRHPLAQETIKFLKTYPDAWQEALALIHESRLKIDQEVVSPALERGAVVIYDRYYLTTYAMQVHALSNLEGESLFNSQLKEVRRPNLFIYYRIRPEELSICLKRGEGRKENFSFDEQAYIQRFISGYEAGWENPLLFRGVRKEVISACDTIASIHQQTWKVVIGM